MKPLFYCVVSWLAGLIHAQHCRIAGQIVFADIVDHTITLKTAQMKEGTLAVRTIYSQGFYG
jgi:hypothetical protein